MKPSAPLELRPDPAYLGVLSSSLWWMDISVIGVDADDTLWPTSPLFDTAMAEFGALLDDVEGSEDLPTTLVTKHRANTDTFGYGSLPFMMTLTEAATELIDGSEGDRLKEALVWIANTCRSIHEDAAEPFPGIPEALDDLRSMGKSLIVISKGVHAEQMGKLRRSGLSEKINGVVILDQKDERAYRGVIQSLGIDPEAFLMVGDSIIGDVSPVLAAGGKAVLNVGDQLEGNWEDFGSALPAGVPAIATLADLPNFLIDWPDAVPPRAIEESEVADTAPAVATSAPEADEATPAPPPQPEAGAPPADEAFVPAARPHNESIDSEEDRSDDWGGHGHETGTHGELEQEGTGQRPPPEDDGGTAHPALKPAYSNEPDTPTPSNEGSEETGAWKRMKDGGWAVEITSGAFPKRTILNVSVVRSTGHVTQRVVKVIATDTNNGTCVGLPVGSDGIARGERT